MKRQQEEEEQKKLDNLNKCLSDQAEKDRERIALRNKMFFEKKAELSAKLAHKELESEERNARLEKFYESVKPRVDADPARMISFTEAELNRRGVNLNGTYESSQTRSSRESAFVDKKPMFKNFGFTEKQINSDARLRIEQRLRSAGLINSEYARTVMSAMKHAPSQARRDLKANSNWKGFAFQEG